eukprot:989217_1
MAPNYMFLTIAFLFVLLSMVYGDYNDYDYYEEADSDSNQESQNNVVGYDEDGSGFVTVSLYGLLIWQFMSLSFGMCLCGGITMCYNRFSQPNKQETEWA